MAYQFSPETCAELHNQLVQKAVSHVSDATVSRDILERLLQSAPELAAVPNLTTLPIYHFFSLMDTYTRPRRQPVLVPFAYQPDPETMFLDPQVEPDYPNVITLYGGVPPYEDEALLFDMNTFLAHWNMNPHRFPPQEQWRPLELVLREWLRLWESGKFYWESSFRYPRVRPWTQADVEDSLSAWDSLIDEIQSRLPQGNDGSGQHQPLDAALLNQYSLSPFAREFLSGARTPKFKYIGPGITIFSAESFVSLYSAEPPNSPRLQWIAKSEPDEHPTLLLPAEVSVTRPAGDASFDRDWGFGKFTVGRRAGLYIDADMTYADGVQFVSLSGSTSAFTFSWCPWGPGRTPRLTEVLQKWAALVRNGVWEVDQDGVKTGLNEQHGWENIRLDWPQELS